MIPSKAKRSIEHLIDRQVPIFLWGPPGIGKSSIVSQIAKERDIGYIETLDSHCLIQQILGVSLFLMLQMSKRYGHLLLFYPMEV
jgi:MoxR-like ATPase